MFSRWYHRSVDLQFRNVNCGRDLGRSRCGRGQQPVLEILEDRTLLSTLSFPTTSALLWNGFGIGTANSVSISVVGTNYVLHDDAERIRFGAGVPNSWSGNNQKTVTGPISSVTSITIDGGSDTLASDTFALNSAISTAGSVTVTGFDKINVNIPITTTAGGGAVTLTANAMATSTISIAGNITTNNQAITASARNTITLSANLSAGGGTIVLNTTAGGVNQTAGALSAANLLLTGAGTFLLNQPNSVTTLAANLTGTGPITYRAAGNLTVGTVITTNGITTVNSSLTLNVGGSLVVSQNISVGTGTVSITTRGDATFNNVVISGATLTLAVGGNLNGQLTVGGTGLVQNIMIGGSLTGSISAMTFNGLMIRGNLTATGRVIAHGSGTINNMTVGGDIIGTVSSETITSIMITGSVTGAVIAQGSGTINDMTVGGDIVGTVSSETITSITITGSVTATAVVMAMGSGTINDMTVGGDVIGTVSSETITTITINGNLSGSVTASGSGTIGTLTVMKNIGRTGKVTAENINMLTVVHTLAGTVTVNVNSLEPGTGVLQTLMVGSGGSDVLMGTVTVDSTLGTVMVNGATPGTIHAGKINTVFATAATATAATDSKTLLQITQAGVTRQLQVNSTTPVFRYFYDSTSPGDPQLSVRVDKPANTFDLNLITDSSTSGFNLARIYALNASASGLHDLAITGSLLPTVTPAALSFFGLPAGSPGGIQLPLDGLASVAVQNNVVAGTIHAARIQELAFGSFTVGGVTMPGETANNSTAAGLLPPGTAIVPAAGNTFSVLFSEVTKVNVFLDTGPGSNFDSKNVLFARQILGGPSVTAHVTVAISGNTAIIQDIILSGDGGSIQTSQVLSTLVMSFGPLGDLILGAPGGIVADVTAPSIAGNIDATNGPISGTIQTTGQRIDPITGLTSSVPADFGRTLINGSGVTTVHANGGISGRIISRGNLISLVDSNKDITGVIAAQGDIGVGVVDASGHLIQRFGGIVSSSGGIAGQVVALGNIFGDLDISGGLTGRIAVKGRPVPGLVPTRFGILGNVSISGTFDTTAAVVSGGVIGDAVGGTVLSSGSLKGIVAAKGTINFGSTGSSTGAFILPNAPPTPDGAVIDAIFQPGTFDQTDHDLKGLAMILTNLGLLHVSGGHLAL